MNPWMNTALSPKERAAALLSVLSPEEKLAQLTGCLPSKAGTAEEVARRCPHGVGQISTLEMRTMETLDEAVQWQRRVQSAVMAASPHDIPAIFHMEGVCGAFLQGAASFPCNMARGATWDTALEEKIGQTVSRQHRAVGITSTLAPVLDVARDPRLGRHAEGYSEDPTLVSAMGVAYTRGVQTADRTASEGVAKHFLASHHVEGGIHGAHADVPARTLREVYGKPFQAAFTLAGLRGVMPCYCVLDGEPMSVSRAVLTDLLRGEMSFEGAVVSDYSAISNVHAAQHAAENKAVAGLLSLMAGMDVELPNADCFTADILTQADPAVAARVDQAVLTVLETKFRMGLFEHPFALEGAELAAAFHRPEDAELPKQVAREALILLKNDGVLPIRPDVKRIALIGPHADNPRAYFGDYTHLSMASAVLAVANSIAGIGESATQGNARAKMIPGSPVQSDETPEFRAILERQKPGLPSLLTALREQLPGVEIVYSYGYPAHGADASGYEEALAAIESADLAILTLGGRYGSCSIATTGEGVDAANINLPACQENFIPLAAKYGRPLVGVHFDGRPLSSDAADTCCAALLETFATCEGGAAAIPEVLTGKVNPSGKLPVSVARNAGQVPVYMGHPFGSCWHQGESIGFPNYVDLSHKPRYPFGFGLSYTTFKYSDLALSAAETAPDEPVTLSCTVTNTGDVSGTEVAQLYFTDEYASMVRPAQELAGFARVPLAPGESRRVTWTLHPSQTAFLGRDMRWRIEKGDIRLMVGASSEDIHLSTTLRITDTIPIDGKTRSFFADATIEEV